MENTRTYLSAKSMKTRAKLRAQTIVACLTGNKERRLEVAKERLRFWSGHRNPLRKYTDKKYRDQVKSGANGLEYLFYDLGYMEEMVGKSKAKVVKLGADLQERG